MPHWVAPSGSGICRLRERVGTELELRRVDQVVHLLRGHLTLRSLLIVVPRAVEIGAMITKVGARTLGELYGREGL